MKQGMKKLGTLALRGLMVVLGGNTVSAHVPTMPTENEPAVTPNVYFTRAISSEGLVNVYNKLGFKPTGKVGVKISTGEPDVYPFYWTTSKGGYFNALLI